MSDLEHGRDQRGIVGVAFWKWKGSSGSREVVGDQCACTVLTAMRPMPSLLLGQVILAGRTSLSPLACYRRRSTASTTADPRCCGWVGGGGEGGGTLPVGDLRSFFFQFWHLQYIVLCEMTFEKKMKMEMKMGLRMNRRMKREGAWRVRVDCLCGCCGYATRNGCGSGS